MKTLIAKAFVVVLVTMMPFVVCAEEQLPEVPGVIGMTPVEAGACIAIYVPMVPGDALSGFLWYNNDEQVEFSEVLVASGVVGSPEPVSAAYPVAQDVRGRSSKWSTLEFSEPVVAAGEGFYVVFRLPEGSEHRAYGVGGGAGIGYTVGANGYTGWLSQDGEDWVMLDEAFGIAFAPTIIPGEEGMVEKSMDTPDEPPVTQTALLRPFPNPFNPQTRLHFELKSAGNVELSVYNVRGERVARLASGWYSAGRYDAIWRGDDDGGHRVASGAYFARFEAAGVVQTQRLLLVK